MTIFSIKHDENEYSRTSIITLIIQTLNYGALVVTALWAISSIGVCSIRVRVVQMSCVSMGFIYPNKFIYQNLQLAQKCSDTGGPTVHAMIQ